MNTAFSLSRAGLALVAALMLAACAEPEIILPGEREDIRPGEETEAALTAGNVSRAIALPGQTVNAEWAQAPGTPAYRIPHPALRVVKLVRHPGHGLVPVEIRMVLAELCGVLHPDPTVK